MRALAAGADVNYIYVTPAAAALVAEVNDATQPPRADLPPGASGVAAMHLAAQVRCPEAVSLFDDNKSPPLMTSVHGSVTNLRFALALALALTLAVTWSHGLVPPEDSPQNYGRRRCLQLDSPVLKSVGVAIAMSSAC